MPSCPQALVYARKLPVRAGGNLHKNDKSTARGCGGFFCFQDPGNDADVEEEKILSDHDSRVPDNVIEISAHVT